MTYDPATSASSNHGDLPEICTPDFRRVLASSVQGFMCQKTAPSGEKAQIAALLMIHDVLERLLLWVQTDDREGADADTREEPSPPCHHLDYKYHKPERT